jgi:eukaryotic-like serine/threonine-protein kinase
MEDLSRATPALELWMIGRKLSHYTIEGLLGKGGMGEVYEARDARLGRSVALKVLPGDPDANSDRVSRFVNEATTASALNHPNIVTVHDIDRDGEVHFIVMEKIEGQPLDAREGEPMPLERFFDLALQITSALGAAHAAGIVHRDIKPGNIMVTGSGVVKVVDFGLARLDVRARSLAEDEPTTPRGGKGTTPGAILGTVGYMSPEQAHGIQATQRSDVFSLGILFYEMLGGRRPFEAGSTLATLAAILGETPRPLATVRKDLPPALIALVNRCLAKDPAARYGSAAEVHEELLAIRRAIDEKKTGWNRGSRVVVAAAVVLIIVAVSAAAFWWRQESQVRWVRQTAVPEIERLVEAENPVAAWVLARRALEIAPDDSQLLQAWTNFTFPVTITSDPPGAEIAIRSYYGDDEWVPLGKTPLENLTVPFPLVRYRVSHPGYATSETAPVYPGPTRFFRLHPSDRVPEGMVAVAGGNVSFRGTTVTVPDFWIDQYEVINAEYQRFVDAGGYRNQELWKHPFVHDGRTLSFEEALEKLVDETGRPGPAGWEFGAFPPGRENYPVEGVSWYEAAAYAEFVGKTLPTVFHWTRASANDGFFSEILEVSNFSGQQTAAVGSFSGLGQWGTYDMAGNVKEWCFNPVGDQRYLLGGAWYDTTYHFRNPEARDPMERREGSGIRLMLQNYPIASELVAEVQTHEQKLGEVADDATFASYARLFDYDPIPLDARVEESDDSHALWRREKVSYTAAYGGERVVAYLFIPKNAQPPYQTVVYFPGTDAMLLRSSRNLRIREAEFYIRSGRVLVYPVYKGTYEREVPADRGPIATRDLRVQMANDVRRTVDYLTSRDDIDPDRIAYYGLSLGASVASFALALEPRFRSAVVFGGHLTRRPATPEVEAQHFHARVRLPVLYVAGRDDFMVPLDLQREYFDLLGTPPDRKRHFVFDGGHVPTQFNDAVREMLAWTDQWMGPVETQ